MSPPFERLASRDSMHPEGASAARRLALRARRVHWAAALALAAALLALGLLVHGPGLGGGELHHEEGRRALPARAMLTTGDFAVPRIFGRPYLAKPPLYFWSVAAAAVVFEEGHVTAFAARLPALLAVLGLSVLVLAAARRTAGNGPAAALALGVLIAPELAAKAQLGEMDTVFALLAFAAASACLAALRADGAVLGGSVAAGVLAGVFAGLFAGAALLTKGPLGLVFGLGPALGALFDPTRRARAVRVLAVSLPIALLPGALWYTVLVERLGGGAEALATFGRELGRGGGGGLATYLADRGKFTAGVLLGGLPATLLLAAGLATRHTRAALFGDREAKAALLGLVPGLLVLAVWPAVRARYALPLLPLAALAAAPVAAALWNSSSARAAEPLLRAAVRAVAGLRAAMLAGAAGAALLFVVSGAAAAGLPLASAVPLGAPGVFAAAAAAIFGFGLWRTVSGPARLILCLLVAAGLTALQADAGRERNRSRHGRAEGARILWDASAGQPLATDRWGNFNLLFELPAAPHWAEAPDTLPAGALLLRARGMGAPGPDWEPLPAAQWSDREIATCPELASLGVWLRVR